MSTFIPPQLLDRPELLAQEARFVARDRITWRDRENELKPYPGDSADRVAIVHFMACLERRRIETGSLD